MRHEIITEVHTQIYKIFDILRYPETHSEPYQTCKMELFAKIVNGSKPLTISVRSSILDV